MRMMSPSKNHVPSSWTLALIIALTSAATAWAQPSAPGGAPTPGGASAPAGGSGPGGAFAARGGLLAILGSATVQEELALSEEQVAQIAELREEARPGADVFDPLFEKLSQASDDEQRNAVRAEMIAVTEEYRTKAEAQLLEILSEEQQHDLGRTVVARVGADALRSPLIQRQLNLSQEQVAQLQDLANQRRAQRGQPDAPETDWEQASMDVLTEEQRSQWDTLVPAPAEPNVADAPRGEMPPADPNQPAEMTPPDNGGPIANFGAMSATPNERGQEQRTLTFNFRFAPWSEVLKEFASYANLTLDLNEVPPGTFNYLDSRRYTPTEALDVLNGYLLQKGYILVRRDHFLVCLNIDDGIPPNLIPNITVEELEERGRNELVNVVFPISNVPASDVAREVELLLGPQGKVVPLSTSNSLVVTDIGSNLRRVERLLSAVSQPKLGEQLFKSYALSYLDPYDAETIVKSQLGVAVGSRNVSSAYEDRSRGRGDERDRGRSGDRPSPPPTPSSSSQAKILAEARTQSLLVTASPQEHRIVEEVLKATDVENAKTDYNARRQNEPYLEVYSLRRSDPQEVVKTLDVLVPGAVVNEDSRNGKIHIHGTPGVHDEVRRLIQQLDGNGTQGESMVTVVPLRKMDPHSAAATIRSLFASDNQDAPIIEADSLGRRLLVRGTQAQVNQVKTLLAELGEDGTGNRSGYSSGPVRTIPLGGRDPEEIVPILQRLWESSGETPLRVVPSAPSMIIERRSLDVSNVNDDSHSVLDRPAVDPGTANFMVNDPAVATTQPGPADAPVEADAPPATADSTATPPSNAPSTDPFSAPNAEQSKSESMPAGPNSEREPLPGDPVGPGANTSKEPVVVTVQGGNLVLSSDNEVALDQIEDLVSRLGDAIPPRTKWSVFYLRAADATTTAMLLEQIFPASTVSMSTPSGGSGLFDSFSRGVSSFGSSFMDVAGIGGLDYGTQSLRIIPDIRSNSLFVSGPPDKVAEIEQVLKVVDTTDLPDSLRDRLPRMIEVRYADVQEVATIVRDAYKDYLEPSRSAGPGDNPLAMLMMGGGGGRGRDDDRRNQPQGEIRLTVAVDAATSQLIVSADDALFQQIQELVSSLDNAQLEARRTVQVVTLENADPASLSNTLGSLIPKVRTSSTSDRRSSSSSSTTSSTGNSSSSTPSISSSDAERQERIRRFLEMRSQFQGGDSGRGGWSRGDRGGRDSGSRGGGSSRSSRFGR